MLIAFLDLVGQKVIGFIALAASMAVPCLTVMAYRGWAKFGGKEISNWRNVLGLLSIIVASLNWALFIAIAFSTIIRFRTVLDSPDLNGLFVLLSLVPAVLCFALKKAPRIQVLIASGLMVGLWLTSVVE